MLIERHDEGDQATAGTVGKQIAARFGLEHESGWDRHANPASVWTRFAALPLLVVAIWSREWIGWWSLIPIALSLVWMAVNPRFFAPPHSTRNWASQSVLGERIYVQRDRIDLPPQHTSIVPKLIQLGQVAGVVPLVIGLVTLDPVLAVFGLVVVQAGKLWYLDRMVLLFADMKTQDEFAVWDYEEVGA